MELPNLFFNLHTGLKTYSKCQKYDINEIAKYYQNIENLITLRLFYDYSEFKNDYLTYLVFC